MSKEHNWRSRIQHQDLARTGTLKDPETDQNEVFEEPIEQVNAPAPVDAESVKQARDR